MTEQPFSLLRNLAKAATGTPERTNDKVSFTDAMVKLEIHSVFDIVRRSKMAFVQDLSRISDADAALAYENACCYATQIVRLYRNQLLSSGRPQQLTQRTGVRSLVEIGPSFPNLFTENWDRFCKVGAIEAKDSPVAYLASLYRFAMEQLENGPVDEKRIKLEERRPDLKSLLIDQQSTFTPIPTLHIVNQVLSGAIEAYVSTVPTDRGKTIYQLVAEKHHPFQFPYNFYYQQISLGLTGKKPALGELSYRVSLEVPATSALTTFYGKVQQPSAIAQMMMSGLGPEQQAIVLEPALITLASENAAADQTSQFFKKKYNIDYMDDVSNPLNILSVFMAKTDLDSDGVEALLAIGGHTPYASPNILSAGQTADEHSQNEQSLAAINARFGAGYVNGPTAQAAMGLRKDAYGITRLINTSVDRFDRLQRMIRLRRWMNIPFAELDTLIMAVIRSEGEANLQMALTENTLRALGTYRYLNKRYSLAPEEFAAFIHFIPGQANNGHLPMFDRVFNNPALFDTPLVMNGKTLYLDQTGSEHIKTRAQLSAALQLSSTHDGLRLLAIDTRELIGNTPGNFTLKLSMVSSLYRQTRIASMLGLAVKDSRALIDLLGGEAYRKKVVTGQLRMTSNEVGADAEPDMLDILMQLDWAATWLRDSDQDVAKMRLQLGVDKAQTPETRELTGQLEQLTNNAHQAVLTEQQLASLDLPALDDKNAVIEWWAVLTPLIDAKGLVKAQPLDEAPAVSISKSIHEQLSLIAIGAPRATEIAYRLEAFVLNGYLNQHRLVEGLLQTIIGLPLDRCEPVIRWSGSSVDMLLGALINGNDVLDTLMKLMRYAEVNQQLGLSAQALSTFLISPHWLHADFVSPLPLSLTSLYLLGQYRNWRDHCGHPENELLDYFKQANDAHRDETRCSEKLASLMKWTSSEIRAASVLFFASDRVAPSMREVDWLSRMQSASELTGLSSAQLLSATHLTADHTTPSWMSVGEAVIAGNR
ncbi:virulence plasmid A protein [Pseudomonas syringae]|uniref:Tc toxin subunit A n=1 Tax=Pseudomonas syringae TaxID=317 RepID=UPI00089A2953|nr:Tc toxin subunit A [Pseudomonas syringae]SDW24860.1 virulence plasmid A protein [Pseudomonas syringae]SFL54201.1 virulence plasmid A protein [Pseudomonas syringae]